MTEFEKKREYAQHIADALPYLDEEQTRSYAIAITGAAATNQMVEQMRNSEPPRLLPELMNIGGAREAAI